MKAMKELKKEGIEVVEIQLAVVEELESRIAPDSGETVLPLPWKWCKH
jgi:hypothetical protein